MRLLQNCCILLLLFFAVSSCKTTLMVNSDIQDISFNKVSLENYADVQQRDQSKQDSKLALGLTISGGGSRAEHFGLGVLMGLEEIRSNEGSGNFLNDVDYYSTVSGGGFAAGYYLGARKNELIAPNETLHQFWLSRNTEYNTKINYNAQISNLVTNYKKYEKDRKRYSFPEIIDKYVLQKGKKDLVNKPIRSLNLNDFFAKKGTQATMPMFVANGTIYNNSTRIPFMPHIIESLKVESSKMPKEQLEPDDFSLPLRYAIAASSGFPGLVPMVKFQVEHSKYEGDNNKYFIRIIDGGVVDNLGFTTLIELLKHDEVDSANKRALIIDCSGEGLAEPFAPNKLNPVDLISHSLMFTLTSKYSTFDRDIQNLMTEANIPHTKDNPGYLKVGITDLRNKAIEIKDIATRITEEERPIYDSINVIKGQLFYRKDLSEYLQKIQKERSALVYANTQIREILYELRQSAGKKLSSKKQKKRWDRFFKKFEEMLELRVNSLGLNIPVSGKNVKQMDHLTWNHLARFNEADYPMLLLLYELASLVKTNVKIPSDKERAILMLAGRYTVFIKQNDIRHLYTH